MTEQNRLVYKFYCLTWISIKYILRFGESCLFCENQTYLGQKQDKTFLHILLMCVKRK